MPKDTHCVTKNGQVVAAGSKKQCQGYVDKLGGTLRPYMGVIGTPVKEKRQPINKITMQGACDAIVEGQKAEAAKRDRRQVTHFTRDGENEPREVIPKPKDPFFRQPSEGRAKPIMDTRPKNVKLKPQLWNQNKMVNFLRENQIHADRTNWKVYFNTPNRKMTAADQLEMMLAHTETEYSVEVNVNKMVLIIDELHP